MTKLSIVFVAALAGFGCKKSEPERAVASVDCDKAITNSLEVSKAELMKMSGVDDKMLAKMKDVGVQHCKADKWPDDVVKCMTDAKTQTEAQGCYGKMTPEQQDKMNKAAMELATPAGSDPGSAPAAGAPQ